MVEAFPLHWPEGWPRTEFPASSRFEVSFVAARDGLLDEIRMMGARYPIISTNIELRRDGLPYANHPDPKDRGVAVYFEWKGKQHVLACDRWDKVKDNFRALEKTIEAMRGIERWGSTSMLERSFSAFVALPAPAAKRTWMQVLDFLPNDRLQITRNVIEDRFRRLAKKRHPDAGGAADAMAELNAARDEALREIG